MTDVEVEPVARADPDRRPMRVLRFYHSAVVTAWRRRDAALADESVAVTTVAPRRWNEGGAPVELQPAPGEDLVPVATLGRHPFRFVADPIGLWRALRANRDVDVLDIHEEPAALITFEVLVLARLAGCRAPVVCYSAQNLLKRYPVPFRWFERHVLGRVAAVHSCNDAVAGVLRVKGYSGPVENLGLGVDTDRFAPDDTGDPGRTGPFRVGYVGRFTSQKGIFPLVAALASLEGVHAEFVGAGPEEAALRAAVAARNLADRVHFRGYVDHDELPATYRSFDVLAVPSLDRPNVREQFGRVIVEAMACGTPVVASDVGAFGEVAGDAALVVPEGDTAALAQAIGRLRDDPGLRAELRRRSLERAERYSWPRIAARQAALYRGVAGR